MGVRVIDDDAADFCNSSCYSYATTTAASKSSNHSAAATSVTTATKPHCHHESKTETVGAVAAAAIFARASKDLIGNCKEFRIENNKSDLRIIGNGNRIRIGQNAGNLVIIGNSTRLKITKNGGHIKYTGNDGRICLGSESAQQTVDYIGCNGILKIKTVIEMEKSDKAAAAAKADQRKSVNIAAPLKVKPNSGATTTKSASFGGCASPVADDSDDAAQWQHFKKMFKRENWQQRRQINTSLPNLKQHCNCQCGGKSKPSNGSSSNNSSSVVTNVGNIVIRNAVNVRI